MSGKVPISEIFTSVQGEGMFVGTPMLFIRTAGCNVGKPAKALKQPEPFPILYTGRESSACITWDGRIFPCDTDYSKSGELSNDDVVSMIKLSSFKHVCITGGEPFLHAEWIEELFQKLEVMLHVETSGTIIPPLIYGEICPNYWITCAPKLNAQREMIERADEVKILVDSDFDLYKLTPEIRNHPNVFLCPINGVGNTPDQLNTDNIKRCYDLVTTTCKGWRISTQAHKQFNWR